MLRKVVGLSYFYRSKPPISLTSCGYARVFHMRVNHQPSYIIWFGRIKIERTFVSWQNLCPIVVYHVREYFPDCNSIVVVCVCCMYEFSRINFVLFVCYMCVFSRIFNYLMVSLFVLFVFSVLGTIVCLFVFSLFLTIILFVLRFSFFLLLLTNITYGRITKKRQEH
jgi:hypothetical protein